MAGRNQVMDGTFLLSAPRYRANVRMSRHRLRVGLATSGAAVLLVLVAWVLTTLLFVW